MVIMTAYSIILLDFVYHYLRDQPVRQVHPFAFLGNLRCGGRNKQRTDSTDSIKTVVEPVQLTAKGEKKAKILLFACAMSTLLIFIRSVRLFRTPFLRSS
jgi:hypothetical protein